MNLYGIPCGNLKLTNVNELKFPCWSFSLNSLPCLKEKDRQEERASNYADEEFIVSIVKCFPSFKIYVYSYFSIAALKHHD